MRTVALNAALSTALLFVFHCGRPEAPAQKETAAPAASTAPQLPNAAHAKQIVESAPEFSDFQSPYSAFSLPLQQSMMNEQTRASAADLQSAGWIRMRGGKVELTDKAMTDRRWLVRQNGFVDVVPLARKELLSVTAIRPLPDGNAEADFDWKWVPNEIGSAFRSGPVRERFDSPHKGKATLQPSATGGWEVLLLEAVGR